MGFKAQTLESTRRTIGEQIWAFLRENKLPLGGNSLGLVLGEISRVRSWKRKNT